MKHKLLHRMLLVVAIAIACLLVGLGTWTRFSPSKEKQNADLTSCTNTDFSGAGIRIGLKLDNQNRDYPRLTRNLHIELPAEQPLADDLEQSRDSLAFKSAVQCLLDSDGSYDSSSADWRDSGPKITENGVNVIFDDVVRTDIVGPNQFTLGFVSVDSTPNGDWRLGITVPAVLTTAKWSEVTIESPSGMIHTPQPRPMTKLTDTQASWSFHDKVPGIYPAYFADVEKDTHDRAALGTGSPPGNIAASALSWSTTVVLSGMLFLFIWLNRNRMPLKAYPDKAAAPLAFVFPTFLISTFVMVVAIVQVWIPNNARWDLIYFVISGFALAVVGISAIIWRVGWRKVSVLLLIGYLGLGGAILCGKTSFLGDVAPAEATAWALFLFALASLVCVGAFEAVRRLWTTDPVIYRSKPSTLIAAVVFAAIVVIERVMLNAAFYGHQEWLSTSPDGPTLLQYDLCSATYTLLSHLNWLVIIVPAFALWNICRRITDGEDPALPAVGGAILVYTVLPWDRYWAGWTLPVVLPVAVGVYLLLRALGGQNTRTQQQIGHILSTKSIGVLRAELRAANEHASANAGAEQPGRGVVRTLWRRIWWLRPQIDVELRTDPSPVDALLTVGPTESPAENAQYALRQSLFLTVPAAALITWLSVHASPTQQPSLGDSIIYDYVGTFVWALAQYSFGAAAAGLLWHFLPGRRGAIKVLPVATLYAIGPLVGFCVAKIYGGHALGSSIVDSSLFTAIIMAVGVSMDARSLSGPDRSWTPQGRILLSAYGVQNFPAMLAFALAQVGAVIAIWNFFHGNGTVINHDPAGPNAGGSGAAPSR